MEPVDLLSWVRKREHQWLLVKTPPSFEARGSILWSCYMAEKKSIHLKCLSPYQASSFFAMVNSVTLSVHLSSLRLNSTSTYTDRIKSASCIPFPTSPRHRGVLLSHFQCMLHLCCGQASFFAFFFFSLRTRDVLCTPKRIWCVHRLRYVM